MDRESRPGWRKKGRSPSAVRGEAAAERSSSKWQARRTDAAKSAAFYHRLRLLMLSLAALALIAMFVLALLWMGKQTPLLTVTVWKYDAAFPPNSYAVEDLQRLTAVDRTNDNMKAAGDDFQGSVDGESFLKHLQQQLPQLAPGGPGKDTVVVYVSTHGAVDAAGRPCLLFSDSQPLDSSTWLPLSRVLEVLQAYQARPDRQQGRLLLILDSGRIREDWNVGLFYNGFAETLPEAVSSAAVPGLHVLNAAGPGQVAWAAPELSGTAFGFFVAKGFNGAAASGDNIVTLGELYGYVSRNVQAWALRHRASVQRPMLVPELQAGQDFALVYADSDRLLAPDAQQLTAARDEFAAAAQQMLRPWQDYDRQVSAGRLLQNDPLAAAELQHKLLRAEQLLWAGSAYRAEFAETRNAVQLLLESSAAARWPGGLDGLSLPLALRFEPPAESEAQRAELLAAWKAAGGRPRPKEGDPPPASVSRIAAADVGTRWLAGLVEAKPDPLRQVLDWIGDRTPVTPASPNTPATNSRATTARRPAEIADQRPEWIEFQFLNMLERHLDWPSADEPRHAQFLRTVPQAISARLFAERAAAPQDLRTHLWIQSLVAAADKQRREAEDLLFVGEPAGLARAAATYQQLLAEAPAGDSYRAALARAAEVADFYATRDAAYSDLPYLARWIIRQAAEPPGASIGRDPAEQLDQLWQLLAAQKRLSAELDRVLIEDAGQPGSSLREAASSVQTLHQDLINAYRQFCSYLDQQAGEDRPTLARIAEALTVPLLDAQRRANLNAKYVRILFAPVNLQDGEQAAGHEAAEVPPAVLNDGRQRHESYRELLAGWERHPALAIMDRESLNLLPEQRVDAGTGRDSAASDQAWLAYQGDQLRQRLGALRDDLNDLELVTRRRLEEATESPALTRAGLSQADRLVRAAAGLLANRTWDKSELDPAHRLRLLDLHFLMVWHGWRVLEDFWGPSGDDGSGEPYFVGAADACLAWARLLDPTPRRWAHEQVDVVQLLNTRQQAARQVAVQVGDALTLETESAVPHQLQVQWSPDLPPGVAAVFSTSGRSGDHRLLPVWDESGQRTIRRHPCPAPGASAASDFRFRLPLDQLNPSGAGADLDACCLYRGHLYRQPFRVRWPPWVTRVEVEPRNPQHASITVDGEGQRTGHVMFVFDCSGSMGARRLMTPAKDSLRAVLGSLLAAGKYEVGLRVYGRRAKLTDPGDCSKKAFIDPRWEGIVHPDADVERLVPLQSLDARHHAALLARFADLQPFGQTPLYLALKSALDEEDFVHARPSEPMRLVVITDGLNFQTNCLQIEGRPERPTTMRQVLETRRRMPRYADVRIDIVGLDVEVDVNDPGDRQKLAELKDLAAQTGGQYYPASDTASLVQALREALQLAEYQVSGPAAEPTGSDRQDLGKPWHLPNVPPEPTAYDVRLVGIDRAPRAVVHIEGGESLLLRYDPPRNRLFYPPYEPNRHDRGDAKRGQPQVCEDPSGSGAYTVQALLPRREAKGVVFYVYLQHQDDQVFTRRPKHVWAEIRPIPSEAGRVYYLSDPEFVPERPVPVFRFLAADWPDTAKDAEIRLWFKFDPQAAEPQWQEPVDPLRTEQIQVAGMPGMKFDISSRSLGQGGYGVIVTQRPDPPAGPLQPARVRIQPPPDERILHEYAGGVNVLKHEFRYARQTQTTVDITSRERIVGEALEVKPLRVTVEQ